MVINSAVNELPFMHRRRFCMLSLILMEKICSFIDLQTVKCATNSGVLGKVVSRIVME